MFLLYTFSAVAIIIIIALLLFYGGNFLLKQVVDSVINKNGNIEKFRNKDEKDFNSIQNVDECKKMDNLNKDRMHFQTSSNIPLSPIPEEYFVDEIYNNKEYNSNLTNDLKSGKICIPVPKLLYEGIWDQKIIYDKNNNDIQTNKWEITDGKITSDYYCSNNLIRLNKDMPPENEITNPTATACAEGGNYYMYYNDEIDDKCDKEISCFPNVFNKGIY